MKFRLYPDSLALRTVFLIIAVIAVAEVTTFSLIFHNRGADHKIRITRYVVGQIRLLQTLLPGLDEEARERLERADADEQWLQLRPDGGQVPPRIPEAGFARELADDLQRALGEPVSLRQEYDDPRSSLWIGFYAGGERWWLILPAPRLKPQKLPHDLWWNLAIALSVIVVIAGLFVSGIVRPLRRLGEAVSATGEGSARKVTPSGPYEVRRLAERHNTMLAQLARAEEERREMLAGLTHDLRAPLARLRVRVALLESGADREGLERDAQDMERIVDQCLAFLRSEANPQPPSPLPIADAVSNLVARHRELGRPVEMTVSGPAAGCLVAIGHGDLQRVLDNLIDNALQYGAPPVEVTLGVGRPGTVVLRVRDYGPGIPAEERERAFEAFTQIDSARATRGSCGLGLAIVRRIVTGSGGDLALGDAAGGGLEVCITFPVSRAAFGT